MAFFLLKRLLTLMVTLLAASAVVFVVLEILPGNAAQVALGPDAAPEAVAELAEQMGLNQPAITRYFQWVGGLLQGDMGTSYTYGSPVRELIFERLALTVPLAIMAMLITTLIALAAPYLLPDPVRVNPIQRLRAPGGGIHGVA